MLVDDHALLREALRERLARESALVVVGTAADADQALELAGGLRPDVVLMDIDMPGSDCFAAASRLRKICPQTRVVFLTAYTRDRYIEAALAAGAVGFLDKSETPARIVAAICAAAANRASYSADVRARLVIDCDRMRLAGPAKGVAQLTPRELETLRYVARGVSKRRIADLMHVSPRTVDRHTENLMRKLEIHDRLLLAHYAIREGLIEP